MTVDLQQLKYVFRDQFKEFKGENYVLELYVLTKVCKVISDMNMIYVRKGNTKCIKEE